MSYIENLTEEANTLWGEIKRIEDVEGEDYWDDELDELYGRVNEIEFELARLQQC